jgi:hypothetical protein
MEYAVKLKDKTHLLINSIIITFFYIIPILVFSPYLDNFFDTIDTTKSFIYIIFEVIFHLLTLVFFYNFINKTVSYLVNIYYTTFGSGKHKNDFNLIQQDILANFISSIILVGSQKNLIHRISYLTDIILNKEVNYLSGIRNEITKYF